MITRPAQQRRPFVADDPLDRVRIPDVLRLAGVSVPSDPRKLLVCPLHDDGTPSFRIFDRGWRCFGCDRHGGIFDLIVALGYAVDRRTAAEFLKERFR
jgi:DNA primase